MISLGEKFNCFQHAQARNDPDTLRWLRTKQETTPEAQQIWWDNLWKDDSREYLCVQDDSLTVGMVGLTDKTYHEAEFSCLIYPEFRKKGYGLAALRLLFDRGFKAWGLRRIYGWTYGFYDEHMFDGHSVHCPPIEGHIIINPAIKLFEKMDMEIYGPCLYPETKEKLELGQYVWRLEMQRYNYERSNS